MFRVTRYPMISKPESGRVGYRKKYRVAGRVRVPAGHWRVFVKHWAFLEWEQNWQGIRNICWQRHIYWKSKVDNIKMKRLQKIAINHLFAFKEIQKIYLLHFFFEREQTEETHFIVLSRWPENQRWQEHKKQSLFTSNAGMVRDGGEGAQCLRIGV